MGGKAPKVPKVVERDPIAEQRAAEAQAQRETNADLAMKNRRRRGSLLQASSAGFGPAPNTLLAQATGKPPSMSGA